MRRPRTIGWAVVTALAIGACGWDADPSSSPVAQGPTRPAEPRAPRVVAPEPDRPSVPVTAEPTTAEPTTTVSTAETVPAPVVPSTDRAADPVVEVDLAEYHHRIERVDVATELVAVAESPVDLAVRPGDAGIFVVEHAGRVVRVLGDDRNIAIDLSDRLLGHRDEQGLTGLEFSADGSTAWLHHTDAAGRTRISAMDVRDDGSFDVGTERVLLEVGGPPGTNHNAGDLLRAPDGTLLVTLGDGEAAIRTDASVVHVADPHRTAHDPSTLRGSILRILPTAAGGADTGAYAVPDDNPFADGALMSADGAPVHGRPEVLAWGLRNPWKIDLDPHSGALWIADVGRDEYEEINVAVPVGGRPAGWAVDFGWSRFEGGVDRNVDVPTMFEAPVAPFHAYGHEGARCAISGGVVYRGDDIPELWSGYVFADFCEGSVSVLDVTTGTAQRIVGSDDGNGTIPGISAVRTGPDGELYVLSWLGEIHRLVAG